VLQRPDSNYCIAAVAVVREQHRWEAHELAAVREAVVVRVVADAQAEAVVEADRVSAAHA
jgi:hypothetical protein